MTIMTQVLKQRLDQYLRTNDLSLRRFCLKINIPNSTLNNMIVRGVETTNLMTLKTVCEELGLTIDKLFEMSAAVEKDPKKMIEFKIRNALEDSKIEKKEVDELTDEQIIEAVRGYNGY